MQHCAMVILSAMILEMNVARSAKTKHSFVETFATHFSPLVNTTVMVNIAQSAKIFAVVVAQVGLMNCMFCPKCYQCPAGDKVSIRSDQICNGVFDCDDHTDERNCPEKVEAVFFSDTEMIKYDSLKSCFWIVGLAVIIGNM